MTVPVVRVFVSSTWLDLIPEHEAAERAVQTLRETKYVRAVRRIARTKSRRSA
ncbi:MAG TPA: hypothetical protein VHU19_05005 [Pyrinomonadaceae bacterium]|nr:hypothetical protein [Pyrinomonadaceae bacterium]